MPASAGVCGVSGAHRRPAGCSARALCGARSGRRLSPAGTVDGGGRGGASRGCRRPGSPGRAAPASTARQREGRIFEFLHGAPNGRVRVERGSYRRTVRSRSESSASFHALSTRSSGRRRWEAGVRSARCQSSKSHRLGRERARRADADWPGPVCPGTGRGTARAGRGSSASMVTVCSVTPTRNVMPVGRTTDTGAPLASDRR